MHAKFSAEADHVLADLDIDPKNDRVLTAIWDTIEFITDNPTRARSRRRALRTPRGHSIWMVPVPVHHHDERWVILWQPMEDDALIGYIGPEDFRSDHI